MAKTHLWMAERAGSDDELASLLLSDMLGRFASGSPPVASLEEPVVEALTAASQLTVHECKLSSL